MYIELLKKLNKKAIKKGDIPVSCIITKNNKIISKAYNKKYMKNDPLGHAEIIAIIKASKKLKTSNLKDCELYVTLKPCLMCREIIKESRIKKVHYIIENEKMNESNIKFMKFGSKSNCEYFSNEIRTFFKNKR